MRNLCHNNKHPTSYIEKFALIFTANE